MLTARESNLGAEARDQSPEVRHSESQYSPLLEARLDGGERAAETPWRRECPPTIFESQYISIACVFIMIKPTS